MKCLCGHTLVKSRKGFRCPKCLSTYDKQGKSRNVTLGAELAMKDKEMMSHDCKTLYFDKEEAK